MITTTLRVGDSRIDAPPIAVDQSVTVQGSVPLTITLTATDTDDNNTSPDNLRYTILSVPNRGSLDSSSGPMVHSSNATYSATVVYTPAADFVGNDVFTFKVSDSMAETTATVKVQVISR